MTFSNYLKEQFIKEGEVKKENFQEEYNIWYMELEDKSLDNLAESWRIQENTKQLKN